MVDTAHIDYSGLNEIADLIAQILELQQLLSVVDTHPFAYHIGDDFVEFDLLPAGHDLVASAVREAAEQQLAFLVKQLEAKGVSSPRSLRGFFVV